MGFFKFLSFFLDSFCSFGCTKQHSLNILHGIPFLYMCVFAIIYLIIGIKLKIESIYENRNKNNEQHFVEENNNTIVTSNYMNENTIGSDNPQI